MVAITLVENFRRNIRDAMRLRKLTHAKLAEAAGMHRVAVTRILTGAIKEPNVATCERLAKAAGIRPDLAFLEPAEKISAGD